MFENQKMRSYGSKRNFYINLHLRDRLDIEFTACQGELMPEEALNFCWRVYWLTYLLTYWHHL